MIAVPASTAFGAEPYATQLAGTSIVLPIHRNALFPRLMGRSALPHPERSADLPTDKLAYRGLTDLHPLHHRAVLA